METFSTNLLNTHIPIVLKNALKPQPSKMPLNWVNSSYLNPKHSLGYLTHAILSTFKDVWDATAIKSPSGFGQTVTWLTGAIVYPTLAAASFVAVGIGLDHVLTQIERLFDESSGADQQKAQKEASAPILKPLLTGLTFTGVGAAGVYLAYQKPWMPEMPGLAKVPFQVAGSVLSPIWGTATSILGSEFVRGVSSTATGMIATPLLAARSFGGDLFNWTLVKVPGTENSVPLPLPTKATVIRSGLSIFYPTMLILAVEGIARRGINYVSNVRDLSWYRLNGDLSPDQILNNSRIASCRKDLAEIDTAFQRGLGKDVISLLPAGSSSRIRAKHLLAWTQRGDTVENRLALNEVCKQTLMPVVAMRILNSLKTLADKPENKQQIHSYLQNKGQLETQLVALEQRQKQLAGQNVQIEKLVVKENQGQAKTAFFAGTFAVFTASMGIVSAFLGRAIQTSGNRVSLAKTMIGAEAVAKHENAILQATTLAPTLHPLTNAPINFVTPAYALDSLVIQEAQQTCQAAVSTGYIASTLGGLHTAIGWGISHLPTIMYANKIRTDYQNGGASQVLGNLHVYTATAAFNNLLPTVVNTTLGTAAQSIGILPTNDPETVGRMLLMSTLLIPVAYRTVRGWMNGSSVEEKKKAAIAAGKTAIFETGQAAVSDSMFVMAWDKGLSFLGLLGQPGVVSQILPGWNALGSLFSSGWDCTVLNNIR